MVLGMSYINFMFVLFSLKTCQHSGSEPSALELKISIMNNKILINNFNLEKCIIFKIIGKGKFNVIIVLISSSFSNRT